MLTEEAHHMFVGDTGIARVVKRTLEVMEELGSDDPARVRAAGAIDLATVQRYINFWFSSSLDLFGAEISSNAAASFANGIKGRPDEVRYADHSERETRLDVAVPDGADGVRTESVPMRNAMNEVLRLAYVEDCERGLARWNRVIERAGRPERLQLPSTRFNRGIGSWAGIATDPHGNRIDAATVAARRDDWLPSAADRAFVKSLMVPVTAIGEIAGWIAPPERGIKGLPFAYEYVR